MFQLRQEFYVQPMNKIYLEIAAMYLFWLLGMFIIRGKARRVTATVFAALSVLLILLLTLYGRNESVDKELSLIPFITFRYAKREIEMYRMLFMNVALFIPLGLSLPFALPDRFRHKYIITVISGVLLSVAVEASQYFFNLGRCETDDVLMNTLGVIIGGTAFLINCGVSRLTGFINTKRQRGNKE